MSSDSSKSDPKSDQTTAASNAPELDIPEYVSEDVYRFWQNHGSRIILYICVIAVAFIGTQVWKSLSSGRDEKIRSAFSELETQEEKLAFAEKHATHGIAGFVYLDAASQAVGEDRYEDAAGYYEKAAKALKGTELEGVAKLGHAGALELLGKNDDAAEALGEIIENSEFTKGIRAEAMFKRIALALENGQDDVVADVTAKLEAIDDTGVWTQRLDGMKNYQ